MKKRVIIHIGFHKTASTWLQKELFPKLLNVDYIDTEQTWNLFSEQLLNNSKNKAKEIIENSINNTILFSDERILSSDNKIANSPEYLAEIFPDAEVVIFVRNQLEKVVSNYSQFIKWGGKLKPDDFFKRPKGTRDRESHNYYKTISSFRQFFAKEKVRIFFYEDFSNNQELFVDSFLQELKLEYSGQLNYNKVHNRKLSPKELEIFRKINSFTRNIKPQFLANLIQSVKRRLLNNLGSEKTKRQTAKQYLGPNLCNYISNYYKEGNRELLKEFQQIKKYNYPLPITATEAVNSTYRAMQFAFITYIDRSGSTFLLSNLNKLDGVTVCPEGELLFALLLKNSNEHTIFDSQKLLNAFNKNKKLNQWNFTIQEIELAICQENNYKIFLKLLELYCLRKNPETKLCLMKGFEVNYLHSSLVNNHKIIRLIRDPRACFVSQKKAGFNNNPYTTAMLWNILTSYEPNTNVKEIFYNQLITSFNNSLNNIASFLNIPNTPKAKELIDYNFIPRFTLKNHKNVSDEANPERISAWKKSISNLHQNTINQVLINNPVYTTHFNPNIKPRLYNIVLLTAYKIKHIITEKIHSINTHK